MTIDEIISLLPVEKQEAAKIVIDQHSAMTGEKFNSFIQTDEGKKVFQPLVDSGISKGVTSFESRFETEKLPALLESKYKEKHPDADPKDLEIKELRNLFEKEQKDRITEKQLNIAIKKLSDMGVPSSIADKFIGMSDEETEKELEKANFLVEWKDKAVKEKDDEWIKKSGKTPKSGGSGNGKIMSENDFFALKPKEQATFMSDGGTIEQPEN